MPLPLAREQAHFRKVGKWPVRVTNQPRALLWDVWFAVVTFVWFWYIFLIGGWLVAGAQRYARDAYLEQHATTADRGSVSIYSRGE